uniref:Uncharacterized protein n=1 Tax=Solanum demissum TaxID=50514 RepID=Q0KIM5_SOLDE|nr:hypothetical protein SDM1_49t00018 [Solanum demissum]
MTHFIFRDLWADRLSLSSQLEEKFGILGARVFGLESTVHDILNTDQQTICK